MPEASPVKRERSPNKDTQPKSRRVEEKQRTVHRSRSRSESTSFSPSRSFNQKLGGVSHYFDNDERDATRTLFVGNLDNSVEKEDLRKVFERFGHVDEIDIKRNQPYQMSSNSDYYNNNRKTYAFIKFSNMDMAMTAKHFLNGAKIGRTQAECKIGYGNKYKLNKVKAYKYAVII